MVGGEILESYLRTGSFSLRGEETGARTERVLVCHVTSQRPCRGGPAAAAWSDSSKRPQPARPPFAGRAATCTHGTCSAVGTLQGAPRSGRSPPAPEGSPGPPRGFTSSLGRREEVGREEHGGHQLSGDVFADVLEPRQPGSREVQRVEDVQGEDCGDRGFRHTARGPSRRSRAPPIRKPRLPMSSSPEAAQRDPHMGSGVGGHAASPAVGPGA